MSRRFLVVPALLALAAMPATAAETAKDPAAIRASIALMTPRMQLVELFARFNDGVSMETEDGVSAAGGGMEVVIARLDADGKPVTACVDSAEAAERFFSAPLTRLPNAKGHDH